ncbi:MAG: bifunctional UDP-N-acetylglucosamine diphosphorylase/glucosamine-1-phosphate N-acetyltransferase GlmU, partial [Geodermatophilaceae bacterium]|nr:bifunctional UDP-N-acetylglucosamine diphosphorylase/glucosamine-1-phosphate N-acetyltransferase GlmU [Geodermatophilaceae bacterium]
MPDTDVVAVVVLAAGAGTRMRSATPKVLHTLGGRSMLGHVLAAAQSIGARHSLVVVGHGADAVRAHLAEVAPYAGTAVQEQQNGSGHAAAVAMAALPADDGVVLILNGDAPLLTAATVEAFVAAHREREAALTVLTADVADPTGLGRIVRATDGSLLGIVEHADADAATLAVTEVNAGVYAVGAVALRSALARLSTDNSKGEHYLTDVVGLLVGDGLAVHAQVAADPADTLGCNDRVELAARRRTLNERVLTGWMRAGVTVVDPATTWVDVGVTLAQDVTLHPGTTLTGTTSVATGAVVGPDTSLADCTVLAGAQVLRSHCTGAEIGAGATVGPYTYLRPGARLGSGVKAGAFVEIKASDIGDGAKVPHLSYVGDATVGPGSNIGAATVFVNYDGVHKHRTVIGAHVRVGSDTMLVAPVTIGDGAYTAAGSVITEDVPPGAMGVARAKQRNVRDWVRRRRPGSPAAEAAAR